MKKYILMMILAFGIFAEDTELNLDSAFAAEDTVITNEESSFGGDFYFDEVNKDTTVEDITADLLKESVSLTGDFKVNGSYSDYDTTPVTGNVDASIVSNLNIDVRLKEGVKAYTSLKLSKTNNDSTNIKVLANPSYILPTEGTNGDFIKLNEMFFDYNIEDKIYVRAGKQNLAWGRGYFFNPTDLINIEKKALDDVSGQREGNFGVKVHVPYGFSKNFYAYVQMEDKTSAKDVSLALKYEFLVKNSEFSVATILRNPDENDPVIGVDFASSWGKAQTFGEFLIQSGDKLSYYENGVDVKLKDKIVLQGTLGYNISFDRGNKDDGKTITLVQEAYYNGAGYDKNSKSGYSLYNPYSDGIYYLANFVTVNKFINKDLTLGANALSNLSDNVHQIGTNLSYKLNEEVNIGTSLTTFLGEQGASSFIPNYILGISADISF